MHVDPVVAVPLLAWLSSGLAAVALTPRHLTSRALLAAGVLLCGSWLLEQAALDQAAGTVARVLLLVGADCAFLAGLASVVAVLASYPHGELRTRWHRSVVLVMVVLSLLGPGLRLLGSSELVVGLDPDTAAPNVLAVEGLETLGGVGEAVVRSEQLWLLIGVGILARRWWVGDADERRELRGPLLALGLLAVLLVLLAVSSVTGLRIAFAIFDPLFLLALAMFPVLLLAGISRRTRALDREVAASRVRMIEAEDRARRQVERDLHDGVQQQLVAILSLTELATHQTRRDPQLAQETLGDVREQARVAIGDLRELVHGIRPPVLEDSGVAAAVESRMSRLPADVTIDVDGARNLRWAPEMEAAAYFVVCEAVTNALKHAPGSRVRVALHGDPSYLRVTVADTGPGLGAALPGRGLAGLRDRVESLGGAFSVRAGDGSGTAVEALFPLEATP